MSPFLRIFLGGLALISVFIILHRIRRSGVRLQDTLFWMMIAVILTILGLFPDISISLADKMGIQSPVNFVFLVMIALLFEKLLTLSISHSHNEEKIVELAAELALRCKNLEKRLTELETGENNAGD